MECNIFYFLIIENRVLQEVRHASFFDRILNKILGKYDFLIKTEEGGTLKIPTNVNVIANAALYGLEEVKKVIIPPTVNTISQISFSSCHNLISVIITDGTKTIEKYAFTTCSKLEFLELPPSLETIHKDALERCTSLKTVLCPYRFKKTIKEHLAKLNIQNAEVISHEYLNTLAVITLFQGRNQNENILIRLSVPILILLATFIKPNKNTKDTFIEQLHNTYINTYKLKSENLPDTKYKTHVTRVLL